MTPHMSITLEQVNQASAEEALALLDGLYEHSPWVAEKALAARPFKSPAHLKYVMTRVLEDAGREAQVRLIQAHPELAGKAMVSNTLTADSANEQTRSGLTNCSPQDLATLQTLNADYNKKFGWPFIAAVKYLDRASIIKLFAERLELSAADEFENCLANIEKITRWRLDDQVSA